MSTENSLGHYLRARRALVHPQDIGMPGGSRRRVTGLRREEVAVMADISVDYYVRLEQGREQSPSPQVVKALARVLCLDGEATDHLHRLARPVFSQRRTRPAAARQQVSPTLSRMMGDWHNTPAVVLGHSLDVVAHNVLGEALFAGHVHSGDLVRLVFLDPDATELYPDWERVARSTVAALHAAAGTDPDDPRLTAIVGELSLKSQAFRSLWARHDIHGKADGTKRFRHPLVGELLLDYESLTVNGAPGQQLVVYHARSGSPSAQALSLLGSLSADEATGGRRNSLPQSEPPR